jgi:hypothetical protein
MDLDHTDRDAVQKAFERTEDTVLAILGAGEQIWGTRPEISSNVSDRRIRRPFEVLTGQPFA